MLGLKEATSLIADEALVIEGDASALVTLAGLFDTFPRRFPIVTPRPG
jgi:alkyl sulfatase BDS1-like metallo-beta-lactamase superfamily hydrolase